MTLNYDSEWFEVACKNCQKIFTATIGEAKHVADILCSRCGVVNKVDASHFLWLEEEFKLQYARLNNG